MAQSTFLMHVGYSLAGFACVEIVKPCQKALACSGGARFVMVAEVFSESPREAAVCLRAEQVSSALLL